MYILMLLWSAQLDLDQFFHDVKKELVLYTHKT